MCLSALRHAEQRLSQTQEAEAAQATQLGSRLQELRQRQEQLGALIDTMVGLMDFLRDVRFDTFHVANGFNQVFAVFLSRL